MSRRAVAVDLERLERDYRHYDQRIDIVSAVEVWFTVVTEMKATVQFFDRYPECRQDDGRICTPDFTVVFTDGTGYVGEIADVALRGESLDDLCDQLMAYDALTSLPAGERDGAGRRPMVAVSEIDHLLFVRHADAAAVQGRLQEALGDPTHRFSLRHPLVVFSWSWDGDRAKYAFVREARAGNPLPRGHDRDVSIEGWMRNLTSLDTLTGLPKHFELIKAQRRFMNDPVPAIYLAAVLWNGLFGRLSGGTGDIDVTAAGVAEMMRSEWGRGRADEVRAAMELLVAAKLAARSPEGWTVGHRPLDEKEGDIVGQLLVRFEKRPRGPATFAQRAAERERREQRRQAAEQQLPLDA